MQTYAQMVTIMIGANDFCSHMCYLKNFSFTPQLQKDSLIKALDYLRDNMPRTVINLVPPPREYNRNHTHSLQRNYISQCCAWGLECIT
jgi:GDSL-like Lipase/Acylhydrolase.